MLPCRIIGLLLTGLGIVGNVGIRFRKRIVPERGEFRRGFVSKIPGNEWEVGVVDWARGDWAPTRDLPTAGPERGLRNDSISVMGEGSFMGGEGSRGWDGEANRDVRGGGDAFVEWTRRGCPECMGSVPAPHLNPLSSRRGRTCAKILVQAHMRIPLQAPFRCVDGGKDSHIPLTRRSCLHLTETGRHHYLAIQRQVSLTCQAVTHAVTRSYCGSAKVRT